MFDKLTEIEERYDALTALLSDPSVQADAKTYRMHVKALAEIQPLIEQFREYKEVAKEIAQAEELTNASDDEMQQLAQQELQTLKSRQETLLEQIKVLLIPKDPNDDKNVVLEIRAGTGGDEAGLFASDLYRMYGKYAEGQGRRLDVLSANDTGVGGLK